MPRIPAGSGVTLAFNVWQADGVSPMDATNPVVTLRRPNLPNGTAQADVLYSGGQVLRDDVGAYRVLAPKTDVAVIGHYPWIAGADSPQGVLAGKAFDVIDPFAPALITLADAKQALQKTASRNVNDDELQLHVDVATEQIESLTGPAVPRTVTTVLKPTDALRLWPAARPVIAVVSASWYGQAVDVTGWTVDPVSKRWITTPPGSWYPARWYPGCPDLLGVLRVGREPIPASLQLAGRILVQHLWQTQRGQTSGVGADGMDVVSTGFGFAIPNRVAELVQPYAVDFPGMA